MSRPTLPERRAPQPSSRGRPGSTPQTLGPLLSGSRPSPGRRLEETSGKAASTAAEIRDQIRAQALMMGFDAVGFAEARLAAEARNHLGEFVARGYHGDMGWLAPTPARGGGPHRARPGASPA